MRIGDLAARSGVSVRSLRYYEEQELLYATRSASGQRQYDERAVERVRMIQLFFAAGLSSRTILGLLPCLATGVSTDETRELLLTERGRIETQVAALTSAREKLDELLRASGVCSPEEIAAAEEIDAA